MSRIERGRSAEQPTGFREAVRTLSPGYFALVMATGIVSIGMYHHRAYLLSVVLFWIGCAAYITLIGLNAWRIMAFRTEFVDDLRNPRRAFGIFTFVAATDVLGTRVTLDTHIHAALLLLTVGSLTWLVVGYVVPWTALLGQVRRPVLEGANGTWFIWVVASQSVAVLAAALESAIGFERKDLALLAVFSWSVGMCLYGAVGILVVIRMLLYPLPPRDVTPPYWIAMGASAITVVAGARIVQMADTPTVDVVRGLAAGTSVVFWTFGSWLIPPMIAAGIWRHFVHHIPLRYESAMWSVVFPLGMYGVAGHYLGQADHLLIVEQIGAWEGWIALAAWIVTFVAMLHHLVVTIGLGRESPQ